MVRLMAPAGNGLGAGHRASNNAKPRKRELTEPLSAAVDGTAALRAQLHALPLDELQKEKRALKGKMRQFERDFEARKGRKVKYHRDIRGDMQDVYARYKRIKTELQSRSGGGDQQKSTDICDT